MVHTLVHSRVDMYAAPCFSGVFRHFPHYLLASLDYGSLIMLSMSSRKGRRVVRKMVLSGTEQGQGILRERELRRMFALDAVPRTIMVQYNGCGPLPPFSADEGWEIAENRTGTLLIHFFPLLSRRRAGKNPRPCLHWQSHPKSPRSVSKNRHACRRPPRQILAH